MVILYKLSERERNWLKLICEHTIYCENDTDTQLTSNDQAFLDFVNSYNPLIRHDNGNILITQQGIRALQQNPIF